MVEFEEYKVKINALRPTLDVLKDALKLDQAQAEIQKLEAESAADGFWNDVENSQKVMQKINQLKGKCERYTKLESSWDDLLTLCQMGIEEDDDSLIDELTEEYDRFEKALNEARLSTLLNGEYDANNAIMNFHAGAGGTEAQDWT